MQKTEQARPHQKNARRLGNFIGRNGYTDYFRFGAGPKTNCNAKIGMGVKRNVQPKDAKRKKQ